MREPTATSDATRAAQLALGLALALPLVWPWDPGPGAKTGSMLLAAGLWSLALLLAAAAGRIPRPGISAWGFAALGVVVAAQAMSGHLAYPGDGWLVVSILLGAAAASSLGRALASETSWLRVVAWALLIQALLQVAIGLAQFLMWQSPTLTTALSAHAPWVYDLVGYPGSGRIYGNLRQPNHYASAVALGYVGLAALLPSLPRRWVWVFSAALSWALVASASRTGSVHALLVPAVVLLAVRRPWRDGRWLALLSVPLLCGAWWGALHAADHLGWISYLDTLSRQLDQPVNARSIIWRDAWQVFRMRPLDGWGWGQIGWGLEQATLAGHLHPLPLENIDNAHDLVLQLLAETGLAGTVPVMLAALGWLWCVLRPWRQHGDSAATLRRAVLPGALGAVLLGLHSLVEYPLWYTYLLWPGALLLGWAEAAAAPQAHAGAPGSRARAAWMAVGLLALALSAKAALDYARTADIYDRNAGASARAEALQDNWFFVSLAQFSQAVGTLPGPGATPEALRAQLALLERASHAWGDPTLLQLRMIVLLRLDRPTEAIALARYTSHAFWPYAPKAVQSFGEMAQLAGLGSDPAVPQILSILRDAPVLRRIVVPRQ